MKDAIADPSGRSDWKLLKLLNLEFANSIEPVDLLKTCPCQLTEDI
jgi:hypothetical protein